MDLNKQTRVGVLGCGVMGSLFAARFAKKYSLYLYDRNSDKTSALAKKLGANQAGSAQDLAQTVDILVLAIKPGHLEQVAEEIETSIGRETLIISMLAGISLETLAESFSQGMLMRVMPNLPIECGEGIVAIADPLPVARAVAQTLFEGFGETVFVPERLFEAVSALAGCGPGYVFLLIGAFIDAGIAMGLSQEAAKRYTIQMMGGAVALLNERNTAPESLKWEVSSPGGTTIAGLVEMEKAGVKSGIIRGVLASFSA